jgi:hypothetical protein
LQRMAVDVQDPMRGNAHGHFRMLPSGNSKTGHNFRWRRSQQRHNRQIVPRDTASKIRVESPMLHEDRKMRVCWCTRWCDGCCCHFGQHWQCRHAASMNSFARDIRSLVTPYCHQDTTTSRYRPVLDVEQTYTSTHDSSPSG